MEQIIEMARTFLESIGIILYGLLQLIRIICLAGMKAVEGIRTVLRYLVGLFVNGAELDTYTDMALIAFLIVFFLIVRYSWRSRCSTSVEVDKYTGQIRYKCKGCNSWIDQTVRPENGVIYCPKCRRQVARLDQRW